MIKIVLIVVSAVLALGVAGVLVLALNKPDSFAVSRTTTVAAPPAAIFPLIADFHRWREWSPYEDRDPAMRREFAGPPQGVGAVYAWDGDRNVGAGRMEIVEAQPQKIAIKLDFIKPFEGHNVAEFALEPQDGGATKVSWTMRGPAPLIGRIMQVFCDMDRMIGGDFEAGLARLKAQAEK